MSEVHKVIAREAKPAGPCYACNLSTRKDDQGSTEACDGIRMAFLGPWPSGMKFPAWAEQIIASTAAATFKHWWEMCYRLEVVDLLKKRQAGQTL